MVFDLYSGRLRLRWSGLGMVGLGLSWLAFVSVSYGGTLGGVLRGPTSRPADRPRVLADSEGVIGEVVIHYLDEMDEELEPVYRDLFGTLDPEIGLWVVCPSDEAVDRFVERWGEAAGSGERDIRLVSVEREITLWSRDRRIARQRSDSWRRAPDFVPAESADYEEGKRNEILMVPDLIASRFMSRVLMAPVHLEGGNVVANRRHVFIGANTLSENAEFGLGAKRLKAELRQILGTRPVMVADREGEVPFCHIDMYVAAVDEGTLLVGSSRQGLALWRGLEESGCEEVPDWVGDQLDDSDETAERFEDVASFLMKLGYRVVRLPVLVDQEAGWMITYTNVVIDRRQERPVVLMPVYRLPALDEAAEAVYEELGFEVQRMDVSAICDLGGAIRCLVNVTCRQPADGRGEFNTCRQVEDPPARLRVMPYRGERW